MSDPAEPARLVVLEEDPFNAEAPLEALAQPLTPAALFYVRNHFDVPRINPESWRLTIGGAVERPRALSLADLKSLPARTLAVTLECAGNGRALMHPTPAGTPWSYGAVSTARFSGTPLQPLLDRTGPLADAEVVFEGADQGYVQPGRREPFARSLSLEALRGLDAILAWTMNGEPLSPEHGAPVRLVVPGWYGVASVKWLSRILVQPEPFEGYFQRERYVYVGERGNADRIREERAAGPVREERAAGPVREERAAGRIGDERAADRTPVSLMRVRAVIARPADGVELRAGPVEVAGTAWSGAALISRVEVSGDGEASWADADLGPAASPHAATPWRYVWHPPGRGMHTLAVRATDAAGNRQPTSSLWNLYGYGNNAVQRVRVTVR